MLKVFGVLVAEAGDHRQQNPEWVLSVRSCPGMCQGSPEARGALPATDPVNVKPVRAVCYPRSARKQVT